jgi:hemerythrin-like domain-containing protein
MSDKAEFKKIADWLLEEHHQVEALADQLKQMATEPEGNRSQWLDNLRDCFKEFHTRILRHFELEEHGGYLDGVMEARPTLSNLVDQLAAEHRQLKPIIIGIEQMLAVANVEDELLIRDCRTRINALLDYIKEHEIKENAMVLDTHSTDLGGLD